MYGFEALGEFSGSPVELFDMKDVDTTEVEQLEGTIADRIGPDSHATILYTSGTTGEPKGVVLNQRNLVTNALGANELIGQRPSDLRLCFLPLSHIFARTCDLYGWIACGAPLALAESRDTVIPDAQAIHPTVINAVPYFYARLQKALVEKGFDKAPDALKGLLGGRVPHVLQRWCSADDAVVRLLQIAELAVVAGLRSYRVFTGYFGVDDFGRSSWCRGAATS